MTIITFIIRSLITVSLAIAKRVAPGGPDSKLKLFTCGPAAVIAELCRPAGGLRHQF